MNNENSKSKFPRTSKTYDSILSKTDIPTLFYGSHGKQGLSMIVHVIVSSPTLNKEQREDGASANFEENSSRVRPHMVLSDFDFIDLTQYDDLARIKVDNDMKYMGQRTLTCKWVEGGPKREEHIYRGCLPEGMKTPPTMEQTWQ